MPRIACLHTIESNVPVFDAALRASGLVGVELHHVVRADLLADAERAGGLTPDIAARAADALRALCAGADAVLLTCSTLGPAAAMAAEGALVPVLRVDAALAAEAVRQGGTVVVLCAVETTVEPTRRLFETAARATGARVVVQVVPDAWDAFKAGQRDRYLEMIARAAGEALRAGATCVALAQASMAGASDLLPVGQRPLNSPLVGLVAAAAASDPGSGGRE
ncbi:Asp/Glu racemase [Rhodovastum atsumiense]|uniref:Asp/Glu racemase n=1 Tax=Rhodovastum atsumiense TaxID=504468 RepID=A0A5M6INE7_9PROT|nr:aspartate/glutamate racemase family protein [Rhodovastum atsumiense]KAA5609078.1 Asp/Glu racemase [Rhodovastum atsumiense]CAH2602168.1 Asp/Glu racemase [Rhodovastum atsumiense]